MYSAMVGLRRACVGRLPVAMMMCLLLLATAQMAIVHAARSDIPTASSSCVTTYLQLKSQLAFIPLAEMVECFRTTPMNAAVALNLVQYAQYAYELHSPRAFVAPTVRARFEALLGEVFDTTASTPTFSAAATGISEFDFHLLLTNAFNAAQDYHFGYHHYNLFRATPLSRPFVFGSRWNASTSTQDVYVRAVSLSLSYWQRWFGEQSTVAAIPTAIDPTFNFATMVSEINRAAASQLSIVSISGMNPVSEYFNQLWRVASNMADDHSAFNDLLHANLNPLLLQVPPQYFLRTTNRVWAGTAPNIGFFEAHLYTRNTTLASLDATTGSYFEDYLMSDGSTIRIPLLVDLRNTATSPTCGAVASSSPASPAVAGNNVAGNTLAEGSAATNGGRIDVEKLVFGSGGPAPPQEVAMRLPQPRGEAWYRNVDANPAAVLDGQGRARRWQRRRVDPYVVASDDTAASLAYRVYTSAPIDGYYIPASQANRSLMVLRVKSFYQGEGLSATLTNIAKCFNAILAAGGPDEAQNLLIDVRGNGGGYVAAMQYILGVLDYDTFQTNYTSSTSPGRYGGITSRHPVDNVFRNSSMMLLGLNMSSKVSYNASNTPNPYLSTSSYASSISDGFYVDRLNATYNGTEFLNNLTYADGPISWTWFADAAAGENGNDYHVPHFSKPYYFSRPLTFTGTWQGWSNITLVTDGTCGSACCMFETRLSEHLPRNRFQFTSIGFGGLTGSASTTGSVMQTSQFCGGSVLAMDCQSSLMATEGYAFAGRYDFYDVAGRTFYPVTMRFNEWHWMSNPTAASVPRQFTDHPVERQELSWDVNLADVVLVVYGNTLTSAGQLSGLAISAACVHAAVVLATAWFSSM